MKKRTIVSLLLLAALSMVMQLANAVPVMTPADILGKTPATDESVAIFKHLLGDFFTNPLSSAGGASSLIGAMFLIFNSAIFVVGMLWAGYGLIGGIAETAQTGEVLGKRLSAVWLPIRMVTGIAGIVPVFAGFSLSQVLIVTMTGLGIGIANAMWIGAIDSVDKFVMLSPPGVLANTSGGNDFNAAAEDLFFMHICNIAMKKNEQANAQAGISLSASEIAQYNAPTVTPSKVEVSVKTMSAANACGIASIEKTYIAGRSKDSWNGFRVGSVDYDAYAATVSNAYMSQFSAFNDSVKSSAERFYAARLAASRVTGGAVQPYPKDELITYANTYSNSVITTLNTVADEAKTTQPTALKTKAAAKMKESGWLGAGSWYSTFAEANAAMADAMRSVAYKFKAPKVESLPAAVQSDIRGVQVSQQANPKTEESAEASSESSFSAIETWLMEKIFHVTPTGNLSLGQYIIKKAIDGAAVDSGGANLVNPIVMFKNIGDSTIMMGEGIYVLTSIASAIEPPKIVSGAVSIIEAVPLVGTVVKVITGTLKALVTKLIALLLFIAPYMIVIGALMAIYIPLIPFITWMGAVTQYAVVVCQGLVGAPIAALSHLESEGEGLGRRTEAGYMFVLNVTFRPALMLFGFFLASALLIVLGTLQAKMFITAMASVQGNSITGIVSFVAFLTIFMVINITLIQGLFNMIFLLPDQVLGLIGSHGNMTDIGKESENKIHGAFVGASRTAQNAGLGKALAKPPTPAAAASTGSGPGSGGNGAAT